MTCPDRPHDLDLLLAGEPVSESVRQHAETCEACADEAALDARITAALASRRAVVAPPALVAAALAQARGDVGAPAPPPKTSGSRRALAAARPAVRNARPRTLRVAALALLAVVAVAIAWGLADSPRLGTEAGPVIAEAPEAPAPAPAPVVESEDAPEPALQPDDAAASLPPRAVAPRRAPRPAPRREQAPRPTPAPETAPRDNIAQATPEVSDPAPEADDPTAEEIAQAEADLKLAFALVGEAQDRARRAVRSSADALNPALDHALPF